MRALLVTNPHSTGQRPAVMRRVVRPLREVPGLRLKVVFTHRPGHATQLCSGLRRSDVDAVIAVGGDGTVNEVVNGLLGPVTETPPAAAELPALALVPTGSANVFARALGFPQQPVAAAELLARVLAADRRRAIHLGAWDGGWFCVNAGIGVDADVIARMEKARSRGFAATPLRYLTTSATAWWRLRRDPPEISVRARDVDGGGLALDGVPLIFAANTNPWTFLGPLPVGVNPANSFDRGLGLFGLTDLDGPGGLAGMLHLLGLGHSRRLARLFAERTVDFDDAAQVRIATTAPRHFQVDGELAGEHDSVHLRTVPDAVEVFAPQRRPDRTDRSPARVVRDFFSWR